MVAKFFRLFIAFSMSFTLVGATSVKASSPTGPILIVANPVRPVDQFGNAQVTDLYTNGISGTRLGATNTTKDWYTLANYTDTKLGATTWYVLDLTLDTAKDKMYWVDYYGINEGKIGGCAGASSCAKLLYSTAELGTKDGYEYVTGLGIDSKSRVLYAGVFNDTSKEYEIKQIPIDKDVAGIKTLASANHIPNGSGLGSIIYFNKKVYWTQSTSDKDLDGVYWGSTDSSANGVLINGAPDPDLTDSVWGLALDRSSSKIYFASYYSTNAGPSGHIGSVSLSSPNTPEYKVIHNACPGDQMAGPAGVAFDFHTKRVTWGNWNYNSAGNPASALVDGADHKCEFIETNQPDMLKDGSVVAHGQSGVVAYLYKPEFKHSPKASFKSKTHAVLKCAAAFAQDRSEAHLFISPAKVSYKWMFGGKKTVGGKATLRAKKAGKYTCTVTAKNYAGKTVKKSKPIKVSSKQAK
ncbi:MAG: hypothetical protein KGQ38_04010 [Actinomycetales bacterium]|nr:hypothetical protein [Actinomycetales bacterium]